MNRDTARAPVARTEYREVPQRVTVDAATPLPICGYADPFGGPCILPVADHPFRMAAAFSGRVKRLIHNDGSPQR